MTEPSKQRFQSGDFAFDSGWYQFDGYIDDTQDPVPGLGESEIFVSAGEVFPLIANSRKPCYWRPITVTGQTPVNESLSAEHRF